MTTWTTRITTLGATLTVCAALAGCGIGATNANGTGNGGDTGGTVTGNGATPTFTGPYASDFAQAYRDAPTDLARSILKDGRITDAEIQEIYDAYNTCLEPYGMQSTYTTEEGETTGQYRGSLSNDEQLKVMEQCHAKTGADSIASLAASMTDNPDNLDVEAMYRATYRCYVKHDLLPAPISEDDYISTMTPVGAKGDNDAIQANITREMDFFGAYYETDADGNPNPKYQYGQNTDKGHRFHLCQTDPLHQ